MWENITDKKIKIVFIDADVSTCTALRGAHTERQRQRYFEVLTLGLECHNASQWDLAAAAAA